MAPTYTTVGYVALFLGLVSSQQIGNNTAEVHPTLATQKCTVSGGCVDQDTSVVIDSAYRWLHTVGGYDNCATSSGTLNSTLCPDAATCAQNCALEGVNYTAMGITTTGSELTLKMFLESNGALSATSPRVYLLDGEDEYAAMRLVNQEFTYDVDTSKLHCGMNGALYLSEMSLTGNKSDLNPAGAAYGTGYCDAQCPVANFINGVANLNSSGACCNEMDIWEANGEATALTPHACTIEGLYACAGDECGSEGVCDESGCGFNPYAAGDQAFYGRNGTLDTTQPFTVVTQFLSSDNSSTGTLSEIRRLYLQDGEVMSEGSITDVYCGSGSSFEERGGLEAMGGALERGMVLIFALWMDSSQFMNWLDSGANGPCSATEGDPALIQANYPDTAVTFSNIKWGDIGSTYTN